MTITDLTVAAAVTGNNSSLTPTAPSGLLDGDLVVIVAAHRSTSATWDLEPGWKRYTSPDNVAVYGKRWVTGDSMPLLTFTNGTANADTYVRAMKMRSAAKDAELDVEIATQSNASAQNIAFPAFTPDSTDEMLIMALWKQDDSTGGTSLSGWTAQGHTNLTTGDDMLVTLFTQLQTTAVDISSGSVTVTGGISAVSKAVIIGIRSAPTVSVVIQDDVYPPRALITVAGLTGDEFVDVYRIVGGVRTAVRAGSAVLPKTTSTAFLVLDAELPFGVPVQWVAVVNESDYLTSVETVELTGGKVALTDAITGLSAEVVIYAWPEKDFQRNTSIYRLVNGKTKVVSGAPAQFTGTIDLFVETDSSRRNVVTLLENATSNVIQIRQPGGYEDVDCYVSVLGFKVRRFSQDGSDERRFITLEVAETDAWFIELAAQGYTYADLEALYIGLTYTDLVGDYTTYLELAQAELTP